MRSLRIDGIETSSFGLLLSDAKLPLPAPKTAFVDVPGGDGAIDLSEALGGGAVYADREMEFVFHPVGAVGIEQLKTQLAARFHGRSLPFSIDTDPGYTYVGRFCVEAEADGNGTVDRIIIKVVARPYKSKGARTLVFNAAGGVIVNLPAGRRRVCPVFEFKTEAFVQMGEVYARMQPGTWQVRGLFISGQSNEVYVNSLLGTGDMTWGDLADSCASFAQLHAKRWSDLAWRDIPTNQSMKDDPRFEVRVQYEMEDL
jgi:hypothetical protein